MGGSYPHRPIRLFFRLGGPDREVFPPYPIAQFLAAARSADPGVLSPYGQPNLCLAEEVLTREGQLCGSSGLFCATLAPSNTASLPLSGDLGTTHPRELLHPPRHCHRTPKPAILSTFVGVTLAVFRWVFPPDETSNGGRLLFRAGEVRFDGRLLSLLLADPSRSFTQSLTLTLTEFVLRREVPPLSTDREKLNSVGRERVDSRSRTVVGSPQVPPFCS